MENKRSIRFIALIIIIAVALVAISYYWFVATDRVTGVVDHKYINGVRGDTTYTLVDFNPHGFYVKQEDVSDLFVGMDLNSTISAELDVELRNRGYELLYYGQIEVSSPDNVNGLRPGLASSYHFSRDDFNKLKLGDNVALDIAHDQMKMVRRTY